MTMEDNNKIQPRHESGDDREVLEKAGREFDEEEKEGEQEQLDDPMIQLKSQEL